MKTKPNPWAHFDDAWRAFDCGFREIDWRDWTDTRHTQSPDPADPLGRRVHNLTASTWRSRWHMFRLFAYLAWRILTRGKVTIKL